jgi:hypothetical protein
MKIDVGRKAVGACLCLFKGAADAFDLARQPKC